MKDTDPLKDIRLCKIPPVDCKQLLVFMEWQRESSSAWSGTCRAVLWLPPCRLLWENSSWTKRAERAELQGLRKEILEQLST